MADFEVLVTKVDDITPIENADSIEVAHIGGYNCVVGKGAFKVNDPVVYIPEQSILPEWLITSFGLTGRLAGSNKNRVKAIRLRGVLSQGLVYPVQTINTPTEKNVKYICNDKSVQLFVHYGDNVADFLGITKYEPEIPASMMGEFFNTGKTFTAVFDIENIKKYPDIFQEGEMISIDEKLHGTQTVIHYSVKEDERAFDNHWYVSSKGQSQKGLALYDNEINRTKNVYAKVCIKNNLFEKFLNAVNEMNINTSFTVYGETFGNGIQDLSYSQKETSFRGFDVWVENNGKGYYLDHDDKIKFFSLANVDMVPVLYVGPFSNAIVNEYTNGKEMVSGKEIHIREGVVIRPLNNRIHPAIGRVILKSVSEAYLLRKGNATEYN